MSLEVQADADTFDEAAFRVSLANALAGVLPEDITLTIRTSGSAARTRQLQSGTMSVDITIVSGSAYIIDAASRKLRQLIEDNQLSTTLDVAVAVVSEPMVERIYTLSQDCNSIRLRFAFG